MSVAGQSGGSFGVATIFDPGSPLDTEFHALNRQDGLGPDPRVPDLPAFPYAHVAESFLAAYALFPETGALALDRRDLAKRLATGFPAASEAAWRAGLALIAASLSDVPEVKTWFENAFGNTPFRPIAPLRLRPDRLGHHDGALHLDTTSFGVGDVAAAAALCESVLSYARDGVQYVTASAPSSVVASSSEPVAELQRVEQAIERTLVGLMPVGVMIEVGAHHGSTLGPFLAAGWRVLAFEPLPANREALTRRFGAHPRLTVFSEAVSDRVGSAQLRLALRPDGTFHDHYHSLEPTRADRYHRKGGTLEVGLVSLDALVVSGKLPAQVEFVKVDTEGHDLAVLRGAASLRAAVVEVEFWGERHALGRSPSPAEEMTRLMTGRGYSRFLVISHEESGIVFHNSSLATLSPTAWGNIVFVHDSRPDLFDAVWAGLDPLGKPGAGGVERRFARLLRLAFGQQPAVAVAARGVDIHQAVALVQRALPRACPWADSGAAPDVLVVGGPDAAAAVRDTPANAVVAQLDLSSEAAQDQFAQVVAAVRTVGLQVAGLYHSMSEEEGVLIAADLLALRTQVVEQARATGGTAGVDDVEELRENLQALQHACDERLELINRLSAQLANSAMTARAAPVLRGFFRRLTGFKRDKS
jgi:FkbM family methyltransferase